MEFFTVKDWATHQHYSKRNPPWIKLHRALLDDYSFCALPDKSKAHLMILWLLASQHNGKIPNDPGFLEKKISCSDVDLEVLLAAGFLVR